MVENREKYEVYSEQTLGGGGIDSVATHWIWRKVDAAGRVTLMGSRHGSLEACFAAARKHRARYGDAPITLNLRGGGGENDVRRAAEEAEAERLFQEALAESVSGSVRPRRSPAPH